ncbi:hypothetical protein BpHYR1_035944 [Brachionus plicatilis]|uniref:Uncharacterized protein n=1 Tax=Brachionus plicatilis TaxID=10195 RepID=A0A3M7QRC5_BRAPC|nr:hypothetical protein BpHYR1_035944 [Brachionus plicatilis]
MSFFSKNRKFKTETIWNRIQKIFRDLSTDSKIQIGLAGLGLKNKKIFLEIKKQKRKSMKTDTGFLKNDNLKEDLYLRLKNPYEKKWPNLAIDHGKKEYKLLKQTVSRFL